jgi:Fic family protein
MNDIIEKYPWISYKIDLRNIDYSFWFELGQCVSKCDHIKQIPLLPKIRQELHLIYLAKGAAATTAIEGNTLGEEKALAIVKGKADLADSEQYQKREIENILTVCNEIANTLSKGEDVRIDVPTLCSFNKTILSGDIPVAEGATPGEIRKHSVTIGNVYKAPDARDIQFLLDRFCEWIAKLGDEIDTESQSMRQSMAIVRAIAAHLYLAWIHPFGDGNGRLARLVEFTILLKSGIPSIAAHLLSNHYNSTRIFYYQNLKKAKLKGPASTFFPYAIKGFQENLKSVISTIIDQIMSISWQQYVYERFREMPPSDPAKRQRDVLIEISQRYYDKKEWLSLEDIQKATSSIYVKHGKTMKSFTRDFRNLMKGGFLEAGDSGFRPDVSPILQRLPFTK